MKNTRLKALGVSATVAAVFLGACGLNMQDHYKNLRKDMLAGKYDAADKHLDKVKESFYSKDNRLLYYMDKSVVLQLGKRYQESNEFLEKAKTASEELWTESIGKNAAAWVTTDNSLPYQGEDFEKVLLHFVGALNYAGLGDYDAARVEARQITAKLELYNTKYAALGDSSEAENGGKNAYTDDAFARWLAGKLSETEGGRTAWNDAWIDYKKALGVYQGEYAKRYKTAVPTVLVQDALRVLTALGSDFKSEFDAVKAKYPSVAYPTMDETSGMAEVVLLHMAGEAPYKRDEFWTAYANKDVIRVAFPQFVAKPYQVRTARMRVGSISGETQMAEDITAIAIQNLNDRMGRIRAKAIARSIAKFIASKAAEGAGKKMGGSGGAALQVAGALFQAGSVIAEESDKRSWITLPASVGIGRIFVPADTQSIDLDLLKGGQVRETLRLPVKLQPGKTAFVSYRTYD